MLDLPEALPFAFMPSGKFEEMESDAKNEEAAEKKLLAFTIQLMQNFGEDYAYIGEDVIGEKFYRRFLLEKNGFFEIMTGIPAVVSAHFTTQDRAQKFAEALKKTITTQVKEDKAKLVLNQSVEVSEDEESKLTFEKWEKLRDIRSGVEEK
ncbi:TPA: hypothetical protein HA244_05885 [Candidatus Micrarchaeota archaeon]|nr:hypothetical protein [Candidatus Micrarchaeota archaeon]